MTEKWQNFLEIPGKWKLQETVGFCHFSVIFLSFSLCFSYLSKISKKNEKHKENDRNMAEKWHNFLETPGKWKLQKTLGFCHFSVIFLWFFCYFPYVFPTWAFQREEINELLVHWPVLPRKRAQKPANVPNVPNVPNVQFLSLRESMCSDTWKTWILYDFVMIH